MAEIRGEGKILLPRRAALKAGLSLGMAGVLVPVVNGCTPEERPRTVTVAGGEPGGFYLEFATLLAELLQREGLAETALPLTTGGSLENIQRVLSGEATFAVALADAAAHQATAASQTAAQPAAGTGSLVALGKVYQNYVHCIVRQESDIRTFADLAGRTAGVGEVGSGTSLTAPRIIAASGLSAATASPGQSLKQLNLGLNQGLAALRDRSVDAMFWSGGVPTAAITAATKEFGLRFIDLSELIPAIRAQYGAFYDRVLIPGNSYGTAPAVWTVGVANLLLCRSELSGQLVKRTVELLVGHAQELIPKSSLGVQFLSPESLINTAGIPLHEAAGAAYRALHG